MRLAIVILLLFSGCVASTKLVVRQDIPERNLSYEISQEVTHGW